MPIIDDERGVLVLRVVYDGPPRSGKTTTLRTLAASLSAGMVTPEERDGRTLYFDWVDYIGGIFEGRKIRCQIVSVPGQTELAARRKHILGAFVRATLMLPGPSSDLVDFMLTAGLEASFELAGEVEALDTDGDGLGDEREAREHRTDPRDPDSDDDALRDGDEVELGYDPLDPDMDDDGLLDGREEQNANGMRDAGETDPRNRDTDGGGVADGWEVNNARDGLNPADDDSDGDRVLEDVDACPNTPPGSEIDARGCILIREQIVLDGIEFETGSASILPSSESRLMRALQILLDNPDVRVEIGGHTDDVGGTVANRTLSQARAESVRDWLVSHGIEPRRMTTRGYGESRPRAANDTDANRALNRRIEFNVLH